MGFLSSNGFHHLPKFTSVPENCMTVTARVQWQTGCPSPDNDSLSTLVRKLGSSNRIRAEVAQTHLSHPRLLVSGTSENWGRGLNLKNAVTLPKHIQTLNGLLSTHCWPLANGQAAPEGGQGEKTVMVTPVGPHHRFAPSHTHIKSQIIAAPLTAGLSGSPWMLSAVYTCLLEAHPATCLCNILGEVVQPHLLTVQVIRKTQTQRQAASYQQSKGLGAKTATQRLFTCRH